MFVGLAYLSITLAVLPALAVSATHLSFDRTLPALCIEIGDKEILSRIRVPVSIGLLDDQTRASSKSEVSIRGSSSATHPKKPYRLELQDDSGDDLKVSLLGMPKESDWILFPAYTDKTMLRDVMAYELWRQMGHWAPRTRYVELYFDRRPKGEEGQREHLTVGSEGSKDSEEDHPPSHAGGYEVGTNEYHGVYILMENIKRGKERLNIAKLSRGDNAEPKITGGYIFKRDRTNSPGDRMFRTSKKMEFIWEEPKGRDVTPEQERYLTNYINDFEAALFGERFSDPENGYRKYIDIDSFVDYHWMQELGKNADAYWISEFYHKDRGGKLRMGPLWDMDMCFGNTWYNEGYKTDEWRWVRAAPPHYRWYKRLFDDPDFVQRYIDRWSELRTNVLSTSNVLALVDRYAVELMGAQKRNYERWPTLGKKLYPTWFVGQTYEEEVNWLKEWLKGRLEWIDSQDFPKPAIVVDEIGRTTSVDGPGQEGAEGTFNVQRSTSNVQGAQNAGAGYTKSVRMACLVGKIHYTLDGTDPRLSGGAISSKALQYKEAIPVTPGLRLFARVRSDFGLWSAPVTYIP